MRDVEPLLRADEKGVLRTTMVFAVLQQRCPGRFGAGQLRTLQRRVREWRVLQGPAQEVYFPRCTCRGARRRLISHTRTR